MVKQENVSNVGIYGMGGAGKTELAKHIYNRLLEHHGYDFVCWITVSPDFSILKLQNIIANTINFDLPNNDAEIIKAELCRRLFEKKFVIILDDLWSYISLHDVGMIDGSMNGCKLIMTTRSLDICRTMNSQKNVLVPLLSFATDSWDMFIKELGKEGILSGEIQTIAKQIVWNCEGLPEMIKCMGRSMRGVENIEEWRNALEEMKSGKMNEEVFQQLKQSYEHLKDQLLRHCFLYSALFDEYTDKKELIEHLIVEGIIGGGGNRLTKFDRAHTLLNKLHNVCLLSFVGSYVTMHVLIRKMAFQIMKEKLPSKLEFSKEIMYLFMKNKMRISLNEANEALNPCDNVEVCPNVSTLLILRHECLTSIEDSFSDRFQNLEILNLSGSSIVELPKSVGGLKNLKALFLAYCCSLKHIPSLAKLELLEVLDLSHCAVEEVPEGLGRLSNLRGTSKLGEEIEGLSKLESLIWWFSDIDEFDSFLSKARCPSLNAYLIYVGQFALDGLEAEEPSDRKMWFYEWEIGREHLFWLSSCPKLLQRVEEVRLEKISNLRHLFRRETMYGESPYTIIPQTSLFSYVKTFDISFCDSIGNLFPLHFLSNLQNLQELSVRRCSAMVEIIAAPEQDLTYAYADSHPNSIQTRQFSLPKMKTLSLENLPKLKSICPAQINCECLCEICIDDCENLEKIPINLPLPSLQIIKVLPETWWKSVSWGPSYQKDRLRNTETTSVYSFR